MRDSSVSERSATPVPASTRMSLSSSIEVVRRCRPPMPPLQPRIRSFMCRSPLLLVEYRDAVPFGRRRVAPLRGGFQRIQLVERAFRIHAVEVDQVHLHLIPLAGAVLGQRLVPQLDFIARPLLDLYVPPQGFVYRKRFVLAFHLDPVDLLESDLGDEAPRGLAHQAPDTVVLGPALEPRGDVHGVPHRGIGAPDLGPHVPDPDAPRVDPDADLELRPAASLEFLVESDAL